MLYASVKQDTTSKHSSARQTECFSDSLLFQDLGRRKVVAKFDAGYLSSDGGVLLLQQTDEALGITRTLRECFVDQRRQELIEHQVVELLRQRLYALALGYEDLNDHDELRRDPLLAASAGKVDVIGENRNPDQRGRALASSSTLNRLELSSQFSDHYRKITPREGAVEEALLKLGVRCLPKESEVLVLDFDATDDPLHGQQEGRFFHGYYDCYCYLPLFCFCGDVVLWAQLRSAEHDAADGTLEAMKRIVAAIRARLPKVKLVIRGDSGFCREELMQWCEGQENVYYCIGLARNKRLESEVALFMAVARKVHAASGAPRTRIFRDFNYQTRKNWSRARRVVGKAEVNDEGENPRFIVTNIPAEGIASRWGDGTCVSGEVRSLYEELYCSRGQAENCIKQMTLDLKSDRTSTHWMKSNQMRLWLSAFAYMLLERLRAWGLRGSEFAKASLGSIRLRLLKVAAQVQISVRRILIRMSEAYPLQKLFQACHEKLREQELRT